MGSSISLARARGTSQGPRPASQTPSGRLRVAKGRPQLGDRPNPRRAGLSEARSAAVAGSANSKATRRVIRIAAHAQRRRQFVDLDCGPAGPSEAWFLHVGGIGQRERAVRFAAGGPASTPGGGARAANGTVPVFVAFPTSRQQNEGEPPTWAQRRSDVGKGSGVIA